MWSANQLGIIHVKTKMSPLTHASIMRHNPCVAPVMQADEPMWILSLILEHTHWFCEKCRIRNRLTKTTAGLAEWQIWQGLDMLWRSCSASITTLRYASLQCSISFANSWKVTFTLPLSTSSFTRVGESLELASRPTIIYALRSFSPLVTASNSLLPRSTAFCGWPFPISPESLSTSPIVQPLEWV